MRAFGGEMLVEPRELEWAGAREKGRFPDHLRSPALAHTVAFKPTALTDFAMSEVTLRITYLRGEDDRTATLVWLKEDGSEEVLPGVSSSN